MGIITPLQVDAPFPVVLPLLAEREVALIKGRDTPMLCTPTYRVLRVARRLPAWRDIISVADEALCNNASRPPFPAL